VVSLVFDAGALISIDRGDRAVGALLLAAAEDGIEVVTSSTCVAQAWRDPARQARLARALAGFVEQPLDPVVARRCGLLLATSGTSDIADAATALLAQDGDTVLTSDPGDIDHLLSAADRNARIRTV
jgi:DNA-binding transcriptional MocR family regulator